MRGTAVYRLVQDAQGLYGTFQQTRTRMCSTSPSLPTEALPPCMGPDGVSWKDYASWQDKGNMNHPSPCTCCGSGMTELLVAGASYIERYAIGTRRSTLRGGVPAGGVRPLRADAARWRC